MVNDSTPLFPMGDEEITHSIFNMKHVFKLSLMGRVKHPLYFLRFRGGCRAIHAFTSRPRNRQIYNLFDNRQLRHVAQSSVTRDVVPPLEAAQYRPIPPNVFQNAAPSYIQHAPVPSYIQYAPVPPSFGQYASVPPSFDQYVPVPPSVDQYRPVPPNVDQYAPVLPSVAQYQLVPPSVAQYRPVPPSVAQWYPVPPSVALWHPELPSVAQERAVPPSVAQERPVLPSINDDVILLSTGSPKSSPLHRRVREI